MTLDYLDFHSSKSSAQSLIYRLVYDQGPLSRPEIARSTKLSLPTVMQNVKKLIDLELVVEGEALASTGGRRAVGISCDSNARYAVGVDITNNHISAVLINLNADILDTVRLAKPFQNNMAYHETIVSLVNDLVACSHVDPSKIIGVGYSVPGIVNKQGDLLLYSHFLNLNNQTAAFYHKELGQFPVLLSNDAKAAAYAETWREFKKETIVYLSLSNSVGGAIVNNGTPSLGESQRSGEFGHMTLVPGGKACYCGKNGCVDAYCNATILSKPTGGNLRLFFDELQAGKSNRQKLWQEYTSHLSVAVNNLITAFDSHIIIGGYVGNYIEPYLAELKQQVVARNTFSCDDSYILPCRYRNESAAVGAALHWVHTFITGI